MSDQCGRAESYPTPRDLERLAKAQLEEELYAKVQLEAARKNLEDCQERETSAFEAHQAALTAVTEAYVREADAMDAWIEAFKAKGE